SIMVNTKEDNRTMFVKYLNHRLSAAMWARVLLLWLTLGIGALAAGIIALGLGSFIQDNIRSELESQQITFTEEAELSDAEREIDGVVDNAGEPLTTGNQAQVYANYIGLHLRESAERAGYPDAAYATLGSVQSALRAEIAAAQEAGDEELVEAKQAELTTVTNLRNTMLTGNTLRGNLLS